LIVTIVIYDLLINDLQFIVRLKLFAISYFSI
jgi:hypothetical protein